MIIINIGVFLCPRLDCRGPVVVACSFGSCLLAAVVASWFLPVSASVLAFLECSSWAVFFVIVGAELWV
ncbi:hypothetical protein P8452_78013 [Trifolium repens]|nr:hypothetical protein P8452_78013 [Trifolium repens]